MASLLLLRAGINILALDILIGVGVQLFVVRVALVVLPYHMPSLTITQTPSG